MVVDTQRPSQWLQPDTFVALGAGLGATVGVLVAGGPGIAIGLAIGAGVGVAVGAVVTRSQHKNTAG